MIQPGLQRITQLLADTRLPWKAIHVSGTNGKGSICAYVSAMLDVYNNSRYRERHGQPLITHGRFTSPHLIDRWDCITINGRSISGPLFKEIESHYLQRGKENSIGASEFELMTAAAFHAFTAAKLDVAVVEVGMGGTEDATNVIGQGKGNSPPLVTAIAKIGMDHQEFLGDTLEGIASHKAGIIKPGAFVPYDNSNTEEAKAVFEKAISKRDAIPASWNDIFPGQTTTQLGLRIPGWLDHTQSTSKSSFWSEAPVHTRYNTSVAIRSTWAALTGLSRLTPTLMSQSAKEVQELLDDMLAVPQHNSPPGRQQIVDIEPLTGKETLVLLDGAHNADSAVVLAETVNRMREKASQTDQKRSSTTEPTRAPVTWVFAASSTKDVTQILKPLLRPGDKLHAVEFHTPVEGMPWVKPMSSKNIIEAAGRVLPSEGLSECRSWGTKVGEALVSASKESHGGIVVVAGSLYLVGDVYRRLTEASKSKSVKDEE